MKKVKDKEEFKEKIIPPMVISIGFGVERKIKRRTSDGKESEDFKNVAQETLSKILETDKLEKLSTFHCMEDILRYAYRAGRNTAISYLKKQRRDISLEELIEIAGGEDKLIVLIDHSLSPSEYLQRKEESTLLKECLRDLSEREQIIVKLRYIEELDFKQIAENIKVNDDNVRQILHRALVKLKNCIMLKV
jgi:RNA polymerase sigma factor (sigma-70 family)